MADTDSGADKKRQEPPPIEFLKPGEAQTPPPQPQQPVAWVTRPEDYQRPAYAQGPAPPRQLPQGTGRLARIAGVILLLAGAFGIAAVVFASLTPLPVPDYVNLSKDATTYAVNQVCGIIVIWAQALAVLGGIMALQRMNWKLTLVCAIFAMLTIGFTYEASFLGMVGFILVVMSRKEFLS
jgi:hypothetical protein